MKCEACKYIYKEEFNSDTRHFQPVTGDEDFIKLVGPFFAKTDKHWLSNDSRVSLYSCPKCFTVQMVK